MAEETGSETGSELTSLLLPYFSQAGQFLVATIIAHVSFTVIIQNNKTLQNWCCWSRRIFSACIKLLALTIAYWHFSLYLEWSWWRGQNGGLQSVFHRWLFRHRFYTVFGTTATGRIIDFMNDRLIFVRSLWKCLFSYQFSPSQTFWWYTW